MIVHWRNKYHLGDCMYHNHFMRHLAKANPGLMQTFDYNPEYRREMEALTQPDRMISDKGTDGFSIDCWVGHEANKRLTADYPLTWFRWWNTLCRRLGLEFPFNDPVQVLNDDPKLAQLSPYKFDVLVVNSDPKSWQWKNVNAVDMLAVTLSKKMPVITTKKLEGITCTRDNDMTLIDIGRIASHAKYVVGIDTGPMSVAMNVFSAENCKQIFVCHEQHTFNYGRKFTTIKSADDLQYVLDEIGQG